MNREETEPRDEIRVAERRDWYIHKFGGTSLGDAERIRRAVSFFDPERDALRMVVVSAMAGVTDALLGLLERASDPDRSHRRALDRIRERHLQSADALLSSAGRDTVADGLDEDFRDIEDILRAVRLMGDTPETARDVISGYGELWSARIVAGVLASRGLRTVWLDTREVLVVESGELGPVVDWEETRRRFDAWLDEREFDCLVATGFIASTHEGVPTTLGRNGSDFTASIFGRILGAERIDIWTDVDGVMSADPRQVPDAEVLEELSYREAMELSYFGASVLHPDTMRPAVEAEIPIYIRNTDRPEVPGTRIHAVGASESTVKGFATIDGMALCNLEGAGMMGVPGVANRLFGALREAGISVVMISQASSEHSICFAIPEDQAREVREVVEETFFAELHHGQIQNLDVTPGCSILAVVGDGMAGLPGTAADFFGALGQAGVNIRAIAQGSSERNISVVVDEEEATRALRAAHSGFYLSSHTLSVGLIGPGNVGSTLLDQLSSQLERLADDYGIDLRVRGIANGSNMLLEEESVELDDWRTTFADARTETDLETFADHVQTDYHPHAAIIDCTASPTVARRHRRWLDRGIHVVTPNKLACAGPLEQYRELRRDARRAQTHYLYETTVGAGLPVLQTLRDIRQTGDDILEIEGILSGTLAFLFNAFDEETPFSEIVREAHARGYTEPDPREDLSGTDVARKLTILGREMGLELDVADVDVESLVPSDLEAEGTEAFFEALTDVDEPMARRHREAREAGEVLRYVGRLERDGTASVGVRRYPESHAFAQMRSTDNVVSFRTRRYDDNPLLVQGPGAGPDVTAGGVFADLLRLASYLGAQR